MDIKLPQPKFWDSGQSFIIFAPASTWTNIINCAKEIFSVSPFDLFEIGINAPVAVADARLLEIEAYKFPAQGKIKLIIIHHADQLNDASANTLLKIIEEPPASTRFLLLSETRSVLPTIRSRCSCWTALSSSGQKSITIPLDSTLDFATVSLRVAEIVENGLALQLLDEWTAQYMTIKKLDTNNLTWMIESREAIVQSPINVQARLESIYLILVNNIHLTSEYVGE